MSGYRNIIVNFNGRFNNDCDYVDGLAHMVYISENNICLSVLRQCIQYAIDPYSLSRDYIIYHTAVSRTGRMMTSVVATDMDLMRLCHTTEEPTVFLVYPNNNDGFVNPEVQYPPSFPQSWLPDLNLQFENSSWFPNPISGNNPGGNAPEHDGSGHVLTDSDSEADLDSSSEDADDDDIPNSIINCSFADFAAWIRREGGISQLMSMLVPVNHHEINNEIEDANMEASSNWLIPVIPLDTSDPVSMTNLDRIVEGHLREGSTFWSKDDIYAAVALRQMEEAVDFRVKRSNATRLGYCCKRSVDCLFFIRATLRAQELWEVTKFVPEHTCNHDLSGIGSRTMRAKGVAAYIARKMRHQSKIMKPADIQVDLRDNFRIDVSYSVARRARNSAISMIYGEHGESYNMLPTYLYLLKQRNPATYTALDVGDDGHFQHLFIALGVCRAPWYGNLRKVIAVDGTHLKGRNKEILFVAVSVDANEQIFPLAFGVGPIENDISWAWFMHQLTAAFPPGDDPLVIVSDQHKSIANAVSEVYPEAHHDLCYYHISNNLSRYGDWIVRMFHEAAYAYREPVFNRALNAIHQSKLGAYEKLMDIGPDKWAQSQSPVRRYSMMTSNFVESINARLLQARRLPICAMIEAIRHLLEKWFDQRRVKANERADILTVATM